MMIINQKIYKLCFLRVYKHKIKISPLRVWEIGLLNHPVCQKLYKTKYRLCTWLNLQYYLCHWSQQDTFWQYLFQCFTLIERNFNRPKSLAILQPDSFNISAFICSIYIFLYKASSDKSGLPPLLIPWFTGFLYVFLIFEPPKRSLRQFSTTVFDVVCL